MDAPSERSRFLNPYAPPETIALDPEIDFRDVPASQITDATVRFAGKLSLGLFAASLVAFGIGLICSDTHRFEIVMELAFFGTAILALMAAGFSAYTLFAFARAKSTVSSALVAIVMIASGLGGLVMTAYGFGFAIFASLSF